MPHHATARRESLRVLRRTIDAPPPLWKRFRLLLALLTVASLVAASAAFFALRAAQPATAKVRRGTVEIALDVDAVVVRKEKVYIAPASGQLRRLAVEGQRVRVGAAVAQVVPGSVATSTPTPTPTPKTPTQTQASPRTPAGQDPLRRQIDALSTQIYETAMALNKAKANGDMPETQRLQAELDSLATRQYDLAQQLGRQSAAPTVAPAPALPAASTPTASAPVAEAPAPAERVAGGSDLTVDTAGVLVYQIDGLEAALTAANAAAWKPSWFHTLSAEPRKAGESVTAGEPVLKVVDNLSLNVLAVVPAAMLDGVGADQRVMMRLADPDAPPVVARIARREIEGSEALLVLTAPVFPEELTWNRKVKITLVFGSYEGLIVPRTAIDVRDGRQGVWVVDGTHESFRPVRVLGGNSAEVALEADLVPGLLVRTEAPARMR